MSKKIVLISGTPLTGKTTLTRLLYKRLNDENIKLLDWDNCYKSEIDKISNFNPSPPYIDRKEARGNIKRAILSTADKYDLIFDQHMKTEEMLKFRADCIAKGISFYSIHLKCSDRQKRKREKLRITSKTGVTGSVVRGWPEPENIHLWDLEIDTTSSKPEDDLNHILSLFET